VFDDIIRGLEGIPEQQTISVSVPVDDDGYYDRECPAEACGSAFKVLFTDWREKVPDERAFCAICGEDREPSEFNTDEQDRWIREQAVAHLQGQLQDVFRQATPRKQTTGFIEMSLAYQPGAPSIVVPAEAMPTLQQRSTCEACGCAYASRGAAFFCPACGHNSARSTFGGAVATVRASMDLAERLPSLMDDQDAAADVSRHLAEDGLVRLWSSFQRFAEATYAATPASAGTPARRNAFQNLEESDRLWSGAVGTTYADLLPAEDHRDLVRLVQQRNVLSHQDGLVDADYLAKSGDTTYRLGQRLVIGPAAVRRLGDLVEHLAASLTGLVA
jgi:uncharacterized Zn finger protein (UPF0148 family)